MNPVWPVDYLFPVLLLVFLAGLYGAWRSAPGVTSGLRVVLFLLRLGVLCLLVFIALNPGGWFVPVREVDSEWVVLVDRSGSMAADAGTGESRWAAGRRMGLFARGLDETPGRVIVRTFSTRLEDAVQGPDGFERLAPDGDSTDIARALNDLFDLYDRSRRTLNGVLLLSDGHQIGSGGGPDPALRARSMGAAIYALALGGDVARRDLAVEPVSRHFTGFAGQTVRIRARVVNEGLGDIRPEISLLRDDGTVVQSVRLPVPHDGESVVEFDLPVEAAGYAEFEIVAPEWPDEASVVNNRIRVGCSVLAERIRVLVAEGIPHWDSKFLLQLLRAQANMQVTTVHRVTGARFFLTETDEPGVADERSVFPADAAELNGYDVVIFGKGAEYFLTAERSRLLRQFVEVRGGSVLFARGKPYAGRFPELEAIEPLEWGGAAGRSLRWRPTPASDASGLFGALLPGRGGGRWEQLPVAGAGYRERGLKPFAQVLMEGVPVERGGEGAVPVLVTRRVGKGLAVVVNAENTWRWDFFPAEADASDLYKEFWTSLVQWMALQSDFLPGRKVGLQLSHAAVRPDAAVKATVRIREDAADAGEVRPVLRIRRGEEGVRQWHPRRAGATAGEWVTVFALDEPGVYRVEVLDEDGDEAAASFATLEVLQPPHELMNLSADPDYLDRLARLSGGRLLGDDELDVPAREFRPRRLAEETTEPVWETSWDRWWAALLLAALLCGDWFLRRRNGLI